MSFLDKLNELGKNVTIIPDIKPGLKKLSPPPKSPSIKEKKEPIDLKGNSVLDNMVGYLIDSTDFKRSFGRMLKRFIPQFEDLDLRTSTKKLESQIEDRIQEVQVDYKTIEILEKKHKTFIKGIRGELQKDLQDFMKNKKLIKPGKRTDLTRERLEKIALEKEGCELEGKKARKLHNKAMKEKRNRL